MIQAKRLHTCLEITFRDRSGRHTHKLSAGYDDDLDVYQEGSETYILTTNSKLGYIGLEVFAGADKTGKILDLDYPAGPIIDKLAKEGNPDAFKFNKPRMEGYDYSFSGLKTSILYFIQKEVKNNPNFIEENLNDLCASVQKTIIDILMKKLEKAAEDFGVKEIAIAGGVSANSGLRKAMEDRKASLGWSIYIPKFEYTTDNAAMIAMVAKLKYDRKEFADLSVAATSRYDIVQDLENK